MRRTTMTLCWAVPLTLAALAPPARAQTTQAPPPAVAAADPGRDARIRGAMARLQSEPAIEDVQQAAMRHFRLQSDTIDGLRSRATSRALLPVLSVEGGLTRYDRNRTVNDPLA